MYPIRQSAAPLNLPLFLLPFLLLLLLPPPCWCLDVSRLCAIRCKLGKGGNLCHCNAFHFAGKRAHVTLRDPDDSRPGEETSQLSPRSLLRMALRDAREERVKQEEAPERALDVMAASSSARGGFGEGESEGFAATADGGSRGGLRLGGGEEGGRRHGRDGGGRRGAGRMDTERALFGSAEEDENEERDAEEAIDKLTSLIKIALDDRLVDRYEASRKLNQGALHYEEADSVY